MRLLQSTEAALLRHVADVQARTRQPSLVAAVVRDGEVVWSVTRGSETGGPEPGLDLQYRIGSITKSVTAIVVVQCRDDDLLDLDEPVSAYVGDAPFRMTSLRRLLSHSGGIPAEPAGPWWERQDDDDLDDLFTRVADQSLIEQRRARFHYSNLGYALLGAVVERVRGASWFDVVHERVLTPLGMSRTSYSPQQPYASGWSVHPHTGRLHPEPSTDTGAMAPAGQLWSTAADMARLAAFWTEPNGVLATESVREMTSTHAADLVAGIPGYGLGVHVEPAAGSGVRVGHGGSMPGFLAGLTAEPETRVAAVALANATAGETTALPGRLVDQVLAAEPAPAPAWQPEPVVAGADELVGAWYWGNTPYLLAIRSGWLMLEHSNPARTSRFEHMDADSWRGLDAYFAGETLRVVRDQTGAIARLDLATYELTRQPYSG